MTSVVRIPDRVLKHILSKHRDFVALFGVENVDELKNIIEKVLTSPDEIHTDKYGVRYFLKKIDDRWVNVIVVDAVVKTAYIIGTRTYRRLRERRWL